MKKLDRYNLLIDAYLKNAEEIQTLLHANDAIERAVESLKVSHHFPAGMIIPCVIHCAVCGREYDDEIPHGDEDDYLDNNYCSECNHDDLTIIDLDGKRYNFLTEDYEDSEVYQIGF